MDDPRSGQPSITRTGTVSDEDYASVMSRVKALSDEQGQLLEVSNEVDGQLVKRSALAVLDELDAAEDTLERIRLCSTPDRVPA